MRLLWIMLIVCLGKQVYLLPLKNLPVPVDMLQAVCMVLEKKLVQCTSIMLTKDVT